MTNPKLREELFGGLPTGIFLSPYGVIIFMFSVRYIKAVNIIGTSFFCCSLFNDFYIAIFGSHFYSLFLLWGRNVIILYDIGFLSIFVELNDFDTLRLAASAGFCRCMWLLHGIISRVDVYYFTLL